MVRKQPLHSQQYTRLHFLNHIHLTIVSQNMPQKIVGLSSITLLFLIVWSMLWHSTPLSAQSFIADLPRETSTHSNVHTLEHALHQWARSVSPDSAWGWKWIGRWTWENGQRAYSDGSLPSPNFFWKEHTAIMDRKEKDGPRLLATETWRPIGPVAIPPADDNNREHGLGRINCMTFHPTDPDIIWVGVAQGGVWKTVNGGQSWRPLTDKLPMLRISDIALDPTNTDVLYIAVGDYAYLGTALNTDNRKRHTHYGLGVFKTTDGGESWLPTGLSFRQTDYDGSLIRRVFVHPENPAHLTAAGVSGVWTSEDAGENWAQRNSRFIWDIEQHPERPDTLYASTGYSSKLDLGSSGIMISTDFGRTWTNVSTPIPSDKTVQRIEIAVSTADPDYLYAVACAWHNGFEGLYRSTDAGLTWEQRADESTAPNILGRLNGIEETFDNIGGQGTYDLAILVHPQNREIVYVGGINIWGSLDGGATWDGISYWTNVSGPSIHADQHFFAYNSLNNRIYVCNDGGLYSTEQMIVGSWDIAFTNQGEYTWPTSWTNLSDGMAITSFYRVGLGPNAPTYVVAGAQDNSTYYKNGENWINLFGGDGMECFLDPDNPALVYGSSQFGFLHRHDYNTGKTRPNLSFQILQNQQDRGEWITPFQLHPNNSDVLYAAYGDLWRREDKDEIWIQISNLPGQNALQGNASPASAFKISPSDPNIMYMAKRPWHSLGINSQMLRTTDGGENWGDITLGLPDTLYFTSLTIHQDNPDIVWITCSGFAGGLKIFQTTDAGNTWKNVSSNLPNLPANILVHDPASLNNTVYVGMDIGVYYSDDLTQEWKLYNEGLPNVIVSDLEIDPISKKLVAATFGRGLWEVPLITPGGSSSVAEEESLIQRLQAIPSRGDGNFRLVMTNWPGNREAQMYITDVTGKRVHSRQVQTSEESTEQEFRLQLPYGLYFIVVDDGTYSRAVRYIVEQ